MNLTDDEKLLLSIVAHAQKIRALIWAPKNCPCRPLAESLQQKGLVEMRPGGWLTITDEGRELES